MPVKRIQLFPQEYGNRHIRRIRRGLRQAGLFIAIALLGTTATAGGLADSSLNKTALAHALATDKVFARMAGSGEHAAMLLSRFKDNIGLAEDDWERQQAITHPIDNLGTTTTFELLPLIEWYTASDALKGEGGVSYLIRTDGATILLDLGLNPYGTDPSPLLKNMAALGASLGDIDVIVISHPHGDHVGGNRWRSRGTFSLSGEQIDLGRRSVYTPEEMSYPGLAPTHTPRPIKVAKGVATSGVIQCPLFFDGIVPEQALMVHLDGKGVVVITGCGHPGGEKLLKRAAALFDAPVYAVLGGLHLPLTEGRNITHFYQFFLTARPPWHPLTQAEVKAQAAAMKNSGVRCVGLSAHDSSDDAISIFQSLFQPHYYELKVGLTVRLH
jgi:7,8-dihydropterin-6-yl-methyl-4-(beta-D-ribofuranosyl)aminobenzene 5'-phosphate synthase